MTGGGHNEWCARDHRCGLREHRSEPIVISVPHAGGGVLTRVAGRDGRQFAEVRLQIPLPSGDTAARVRLVAVLSAIPVLLGRRAAHG